MKELMREMTASIRNDIKATMKKSMNTKNNEQQISLTPNSQPELITQDTPQLSPRVEELNDLIEEMKFEKNPTRGNPQYLLMKPEPIHPKSSKRIYK